MAVAGASFGMVAIVAVIFALILQVAQAQSPSPAPAPTSDGVLSFLFLSYFLFHF